MASLGVLEGLLTFWNVPTQRRGAKALGELWVATLTHCREDRQAKRRYYGSVDDKYAYQVLLVAFCPNCDRTILGWYGVLPDGNRGYLHERMRGAEEQFWLNRLELEDELDALPHTGRDTKARPHVSEYTMLISQNPAQIFEKVLGR